MTCPLCSDWGTIRASAWGATAAFPCPTCRPVEHQVARGGEQGDTAEEMELHRLRRRVAELEADLAALKSGRTP